MNSEKRLFAYSDYRGNVRAERFMTPAMKERVNNWLMRHNYTDRWVRIEIAEDWRAHYAPVKVYA